MLPPRPTVCVISIVENWSRAHHCPIRTITFQHNHVALDLDIDAPESLPSLQVFADSLRSLMNPYDYMETRP